jgi:tetratricopeptide (TPR) repeat protein
VTAEFADLFSGARVPSWLKRFETEPLLAIDALLVGGADLGFLSADEPTSVLLDWLDMLGEQTDFPQDVDRTLAEWIARYWGHTTLPQAQHSAALTSVAWVRVGELLSVNSTLSTAAAQLRERFIAEPRFLETLHEGRGRDPVGRAWQALARHQTNRDLIGHWWRLCALPVDEPWYRGEYGVWGLRRLPPETPANSGRFSDEAAEGLVRLGVGLSIRAEEGFLDEQTAEREFLRIARLLTVAFPFPNSWEAFWRQERDQKPSSRCLPEKWIRKFVPPRRASKNACPPPRPSKRTRDPQWAHRAGDLAQRLRGNPSDAELDADRLLDEQITYATSTGDTYNLVRTACKLATAIQGQRPELALRWATLAGEFDPWNGYAWTIRASTLHRLRRLPEALAISIEATVRFPDDVVARAGLAEVLKADKRLAEAEQVYRETIERFPDNVVARNGLAEVLKADKRFAEAEKVYQETIERFPDNVVARAGLAEVLNADKRLAEAELAYRETIERFPDNQRSEKSSNKLPVTPESPSTVVPTTPSTFRRQDATILLTDIYLIRRWARLGGQTGDFNKATSRARDLLVRVTPLIENDAAASYEAGLLEIGLGEWEAAVRLLTEAARRFPGSVRVRFALARAQRAVAQHQSRRLDAASERQVIGPWRQLGKMDPRCRPVQLLGEGRAWLSLQDGSTVTDRARDAFGDLGRWLSKRLKPIHAQPPAYATCLERDRMHFQPLESVEPFVGWWAREVQATLFGSNAVASVDELSDLSPVLSRLKNNAALLDNLEEEGLSRYFSI